MPPRSDNSYPRSYNPFDHPIPESRLRDDVRVIDLTNWAWQQHTTPREKVVLVAVATRTGATVADVAQACCLTPTAALEAVRELCWTELITVLEGDGLAVKIALEAAAA